MIRVICGSCGSDVLDWNVWRVNGKVYVTAQHCGMRHQFEVGINLTMVLPAAADPPRSPAQ